QQQQILNAQKDLAKNASKDQPGKDGIKPPMKELKFAVKDPEAGRVYLTSLKPVSTSQQAPGWNGGPPGQLGHGRQHEVSGGWHAEKGLSIGPPLMPQSPTMSVEYQLPKDLQPCMLQMIVGLDDSSGAAEKPGVEFEVVGDGKVLWKSRTIKRIGDYEDCRIKLDGIDRLVLRYKTLDAEPNQRWTLPVWV